VEASRGDSGMKDLFTRIRPQIMLALIVLGAVSLYSLRLGHVEVTTGAVTGMVGLSMKILEDKD
jgi:hypothetical protein